MRGGGRDRVLEADFVPHMGSLVFLAQNIKYFVHFGSESVNMRKIVKSRYFRVGTAFICIL